MTRTESLSATPARRPRGARVSLALLSPYSGTNLGDGAIQESALRCLRQIMPSAEVVGVTLDPPKTSQVHGIECFPITGVEIEFYSAGMLPNRSVPFGTGAVGPGIPRSHLAPRSGFRGAVKRVPVLGPALRMAVRSVRRVWALRHEVAHTIVCFRLARRLDLILVAGGGQLDDEWGGAWGHPYALFKWAVLARLAGAKFAFASVGVCGLRHPLSRWFIRRALRLADYRSYRDAGSRELAAEWVNVKEDPVVPDMALWLEPEPEEKLRATIGRAVAVGPIAYGHPEYSPTKDPVAFRRYLDELAEFASRVLARGFDLMVFSSTGTDRAVVQEFSKAVRETLPEQDRSRVTTVAPPSAWELLDAIGRCDFVVASRLHGVTLAHVQHLPTIALSFDRKVDAHMRDMGQEAYCSSIRMFDAESLDSMFDALVRHASRESKIIEGRVAAARAQIISQADRLAAFICNTESEG